jgi:hypothetical protein
MAVQITCIKKQGGYHEDPHHAIESVGWLNEQSGEKGSSTRLDMYDWIKNKGGIAYVRDSYGNSISVGTAISPNGTKFIRTHADGKWTNNLLALPECS